LEEPDEFLLMLRATGGRVEKIRSFSLDCEVDAGGLPVTWLKAVRPAEAVSFLASLVGGDEVRAGPALAAIALHSGAEAESALGRFLEHGETEVRKKAAFWLGNARGRRGYDLLRVAVGCEQETETRKHLTFALSQSPVPEAVETLLAMARSDREPEVRGQALFWLAQKAGRKAMAAIENALREDPDTDVKRKAVFALTQLPEDEGIPKLIQVARTNRNPEVREQAIFWLGQSKDSRALDFIEEILLR
jgi:HEAT repeat protein